MPNSRLFWKLVITADKETFHFILFQWTDVNPREAWVSGSERSGKFEKKINKLGQEITGLEETENKLITSR